MKKLILIATICIALGLLCVLVPSLVFAQGGWQSYQDVDHTWVWGGIGEEYNATYYVAYMHGEGTPFVKSAFYNIGYYDGGGTKTATDSHVKADPPYATLVSQYSLMTDPLATAGTWHAVVYPDANAPPITYDAEDPLIVASDSFEVLQEAIPEFPSVMAGIGVAGLCFGIYYWMRKKAHHIPT